MSARKSYSTSIYHTYEEARRICSTPSRFLRYIRDNKESYYKLGDFDSVEGVLKYIPDFIYGRNEQGSPTSEMMEMIGETIKEVFSIVDEDEDEVELFRGVRLEDESDVDWKDLGNCWTIDETTASDFLDRWVDDSLGDKYIISCDTSLDNVDWILSVCLRLTHMEEYEIRIYDSKELYNGYVYPYESYWEY